jgi:hypothetical protein
LARFVSAEVSEGFFVVVVVVKLSAYRQRSRRSYASPKNTVLPFRLPYAGDLFLKQLQR